MTTIRPAVSEDAGGIAVALVESAEHHARLDAERYRVPAAETMPAHHQYWGPHSPEARPARVTLVAEQDGEIVGFIDAALQQSPDRMHRPMTYCHVAEIAVRAQYQRQGIGRQLVEAVEDWGRRHGAAFASLEYHSANTRAGAFYERKMGYRAAAITAIKKL